MLEAQRKEEWYKHGSLQAVKGMVSASSKELNHFHKEMMVVISRCGLDFMPGSATRLWLWGQQWEQCIGAVCIDGSSPAQLRLLELHWCKSSLIPPRWCESLILALDSFGRSPRICCMALSSQGMLSMGFVGRGISTSLCLGFLVGGTKVITLTHSFK